MHATSLCEPNSGIPASLRSSWLNCSVCLAGFHTLSPWQRSQASRSLRTSLCGWSLAWHAPHALSVPMNLVRPCLSLALWQSWHSMLACLPLSFQPGLVPPVSA